MEKKKETDDFMEETILKRPGEALALWKPKKKGEEVVGKLMAISETRFNKILRISTSKGIVSVPVSTFLADIDFEPLIGEVLSFVFEGVSGERDCKLFTVKVRHEKF